MITNPLDNPSATIIRSLIQQQYTLSVYSQDLPQVLQAEVVELNSSTGRMILEIEYIGENIERFFNQSRINFDLESMRGPQGNEVETYSLSNVAAKLLKTDSVRYKIECQLPDSVFVKEKRGAVRIPFILGMLARVHIEVYLHELNISGKLRNLSVGGCMVDISLTDSISLNLDHHIPGITLEFPNGDSFFSEGKIRHIRPLGSNGHAAVGIAFINLSTLQTEALFHYVNESEREAAYRTGTNDKMVYHSALFIPGAKEKKIQQREAHERDKRARQTPMERGIMDVAHQLQVGLMYIKNRGVFPSEIFYDCADTLRYLIEQDRKKFLYALTFLHNESDWARHSIQVAGQLADMLLLRDPYAPIVREAILGALLHNLGKPLLISAQLPTLKANMMPAQKAILLGHVDTLSNKVKELGWVPNPTCQDIIEKANERLDGTGYPARKQGDQLSELIRLVSVIKAINKLMHARNGTPPHSPIDAYRKIHEADKAFDKTVLVEYIQVYGLYPIGTLAKFSGGFLAWVMDINGKGMPCQVNVIKNLRFPDANIHSIINSEDMQQIGKLEGIVNPLDYGLKITSI